ncbi:MAG: pyridoxal 5'-phosphate synthase glutaminase subunit PdxT [Mailhella sp.]|nr:pyridoxal 5'-phosphate synthase glutaminase subunit PdxT [Mailhella sp.]
MSLEIGVIAMQGAFREHCAMVERCGAHAVEIRQAPDPADARFAGLDRFDGLIIPGGESTVIGRLLVMCGLVDPIRGCGRAGMPVYGSCAGLIMLCSEIEGPDGMPLDQPRLGLLDARARRNAFGRQIDSFTAPLPIRHVGPDIEAVYIRAPLITRRGEGVEVLAEADLAGTVLPAAVRQGNILASAFHPELTEDTRFHRYFLSMCEDYAAGKP